MIKITIDTSYLRLIPVVALLAFVAGCATTMPQPGHLRVPEPIPGNTGKYMCPYTVDGTVTEWIGKAKNAKVFQDVFKAGLTYAGTKALEQAPIVGGILGHWAGKQIGREVAIQAAGGRDFIKSKSDLSFNNVDDLAVYMYAKHSTHEDYRKVLKVCWAIYPELQRKYVKAIRKAQILTSS
jgi:hypothetical protein